MRRAAHGLAEHVLDLLRQRSDSGSGPGRVSPVGAGHPARVLVLVGSGDNGGDALFAAAELAENGCAVHVVGTGSRMHAAGRAALVAAAGPSAFTAPDEDPVRAASRLLDEGVDVILDGILGILGIRPAGNGPTETGAAGGGDAARSASPALRGTAREVLIALRAAGTLPPVVAVDIPSGVDADTGEVPDPAVLPATMTVTFGGVKAGLLLGDGARLAGAVVLVEIGVERDLDAMEPAVDLR